MKPGSPGLILSPVLMEAVEAILGNNGLAVGADCICLIYMI
jgi:hypothetical protein